ncbi:MAG: serine hydrolase domain-containing protein, partial [Limisphaerales bacterium]
MRRFIQPFAISIGIGLLTPGCRQPEPIGQPQTKSVSIALDQSKLAEVDEEINEAITEGKCPGGVLLFDHKGEQVLRTYGNRALVPAVEPATADTIYDMASLTKVVATAPAILKLIEQGKLALDDKVQQHIAEFKGDGKEEIIVRQLVAHTSGLRPGLGRRPEWKGAAKAIEFACGEKLQTPPDTKFRYSDINYILLGEIVRRVSGEDLHAFTQRELYGPMKMTDTGFLPDPKLKPRIAPTEQLGATNILRGIVHDPTSRRMEGIAGHAGLFSTAADLARYVKMILNQGTIDGVQVFKPESIKLMTEWQTPNTINEVRGLGWDIDTAYSSPRGKLFPGGSFGHTGWTGTSIWIDPYSRSFFIFLSNRNHPKGGAVVPLRKRISTLLAESIPNGDVYFGLSSYLPNFPVKEKLASKKVLNGIDVL